MYFYGQDPILIISRPKLTGGGAHWGVSLPDGRVAHCTAGVGVELLSDIDAFAQGRDVTILQKVPPHLNDEVMHRLSTALARPQPYHLTNWNCEIFANWLTCKKPESPQVSGWAFITAAALVASAFSR
jgi:hypothetical protein